jgi:1,2-diacylglycerol 3-alpha-glucosyltransferase
MVCPAASLSPARPRAPASTSAEDAAEIPRHRAREEEFRRIGIITDHLRVSYANGSSFASQFLRREFAKRAHDVTIIGPRDPDAQPSELPSEHIALDSLPLRNHPGVHLPFPTSEALRRVARRELDVLLGQTCTGVLEVGSWLRRAQRVPYLCVNTVHLPSVYNVMLPACFFRWRGVRRLFEERLIPYVERQTVDAYNQSDGLIVLSEGMGEYWLRRGLRVPVFVIPRSVEPKVFDRGPGSDPFDVRARPGGRLLCVCRHTREKGLERLIRLFARHVAPYDAGASLTLVGDGPDHVAFRSLAARLGLEGRIFFPGEEPLSRVPDYYRHADLFVYTSLSETYGQVVSEASWCGLATVALDDGMGVCSQIVDRQTGVLVRRDIDPAEADGQFAREALALLSNPGARAQMATRAALIARGRVAPERIVERYYDAFREARRHLERAPMQQTRAECRRRLRRWAMLHLLIWGMSHVRRRAVLNRNGSAQPDWGELAVSSELRAL